MCTLRSPRLLVLPGWDDDGQQQFDALQARLARKGWLCRRGQLPDSRWPAEQRARVTREDALRLTLDDYFALESQGSGPMAVLGFSFGAYMAAYLTSARPVRWLVLRSPALYPDQDWHRPKEELDKADLDAFRHQLLGPAHSRALRCCARFKGDVLLVDSEHDRVIPPTVIASYAGAFERARSLTRYTVQGADHALTDPAWQADYQDRVVRWLSEQTGH